MVFDGSGWHQHYCNKTIVKEINGKWYCKIHDPDYVKKKGDARKAKWDEENRKSNESCRRKSAVEKACEGVPTEVLETLKLKELLNQLSAKKEFYVAD